jgi:hypothetical protein
MRRFLVSGSLLLISAAASISPASAAPILYNINFTTNSGPAPTTGSFTYDATAPVFTNFLVTWDSIQYNLTASANAPGISGPPACIGSATGAAASFLLMNGSCASNAAWQGAPFIPSAFSFQYLLFSGQSITAISISGEGPTGPSVLGSGSWSITAVNSVPEPSTLVLTAVAGALLAARRRFRR